MPLICRLGDVGTHGGAICTASPDVYDNGPPVARHMDLYCCPIHGPNPIVECSPDVFVNARGIIRVGDHSACGAAMGVTHSPTTHANDMGH